MAHADPCTMRVTDMDMGTYRGEEIQILGEIWLHCEPFTAFRIDFSQMPATSGPRTRTQHSRFIYKLFVSEDAGLRVEERYDFIRLHGQTAEDRETTIPFTLTVPSGLDIVAGEYMSSFQVELHAQ